MTYLETYQKTSKSNFTAQNGLYGNYGGRYVPPVLEDKLQHLREHFFLCQNDPQFISEFHQILKEFTGRPSPLYFARRLSEYVGSAIYLKREDLNHTGSHKINNTIGQILLAARMGKRSVIAETGAGQHGVATATAAAFMGMKCKVFMGAEDASRQSMNVRRMELLGAEVVTTSQGRGTLKDAVDAALGY
jgi:tryptophan synthase beta chain